MTAAALAGYGWWAVGRPPFSRSATLAVLGAGAAAALVGAVWGRPARPPRPTTGVAPWVALVAVAGAWQMAAYLQHPRHDHPTLSSLTNALLDSQPARAAAFVCWIAAAAKLARR